MASDLCAGPLLASVAETGASLGDTKPLKMTTNSDADAASHSVKPAYEYVDMLSQNYLAIDTDLSKTISGSCDNRIDGDIQNALDVLGEPLLYTEYLAQLGLVSALENEEHSVRRSRGGRRKVANNQFIEKHPCIPDINYGLLRRVAISLGVSTTGGKVQILANIQQYCFLFV